MTRPDDMRGPKDDAPFLDRWAKRKAAAEQPAAAPAEAEPPPTAEDVEAIVARLPSLDSIAQTRDVTAFLARGVPEALRNAALDRLWRADPAIRDRVADAIDYAENYLAPETIAGFGAAPADAGRALVERLHRGLEALAEAPQNVAEAPQAAVAARPAPRPAPPDAPPAGEAATASAARAAPRRHGGALPDSRKNAT